MLTHFPKRKFEQLGFKDLLEAWEPAHVKKTPSFSYLLPRVQDEFGGVKAREVTTARVQHFLGRLRDEAGRSASSVNKYRTIPNDLQRVRPSRTLRRKPGPCSPPVPGATRA